MKDTSFLTTAGQALQLLAVALGLFFSALSSVAYGPSISTPVEEIRSLN